MKRIVNWRKQHVEYLISEHELLDKLGISEPMLGNVYYSPSNRTLKIFCKIPEGEKR